MTYDDSLVNVELHFKSTLLFTKIFNAFVLLTQKLKRACNWVFFVFFPSPIIYVSTIVGQIVIVLFLSGGL